MNRDQGFGESQALFDGINGVVHCHSDSVQHSAEAEPLMHVQADAYD